MKGSEEHRTIEQLAASIKANVDELANGTLSLAEIEAVTAEMRELYERLVVIRHKAYEKNEKGKKKTENGKRKTETGKLKEEREEENDETENLKVEATEEGSIAEDQKIAEPAPSLFKLNDEEAIEDEEQENQTSLIDQIEELGEESVNEKLSDADNESLAEKLEDAPIEDLNKAIGLNKRFWFIKELFNDDKEAFENALKELENAGDHGSAQKWFDAEVRPNLKEDHDPTALRKFLELLERRYLADA